MKRTDTFLESLKAIKKNKKALEELDRKIKRLQEDPIHVGSWLSGALHSKGNKNSKEILSHFHTRQSKE